MNETRGHVIGCQCFLCLGYTCHCVVKNREEGEEQREWFKRWMCMHHWMQTDYYKAKLEGE